MLLNQCLLLSLHASAAPPEEAYVGGGLTFFFLFSFHPTPVPTHVLLSVFIFQLVLLEISTISNFI